MSDHTEPVDERPDDQRPDAYQPRLDGAPSTGHEEIDRALASLADLDGAPLDEHQGRLAGAHEIINSALGD